MTAASESEQNNQSKSRKSGQRGGRGGASAPKSSNGGGGRGSGKGNRGVDTNEADNADTTADGIQELINRSRTTTMTAASEQNDNQITKSRKSDQRGGRGGGRRGGRGGGSGRGSGKSNPRGVDFNNEADSNNADSNADGIQKNRRRPGRNNNDTPRNVAPVITDSNHPNDSQEKQSAANGNNNKNSRNGGASEKSRDNRNPNGRQDRKKANAKERGSGNDTYNHVEATNNSRRTNNNRPPGPNTRRAKKEDHNNDQSNNDSKQQQQRNRPQNKNKSRTKKVQYPPHASHSTCLQRYTSGDPTIIRGKIRVMPSKSGAAFVTCDRGSVLRDVVVKDEKDRNRALDGEYVFVELEPLVMEEGGDCDGGVVMDGDGTKKEDITIADYMTNLELNSGAEESCKEASDDKAKNEMECVKADIMAGMADVDYEEEEYLIEEDVNAKGETMESEESINDEEENIDDEEEVEMWQDDEVQMSLWDPVVNLRKKSKKPTTNQGHDKSQGAQRHGKVISILPPKSSAGQQPSEFTPTDESHKQQIPKRTIVGTLTQLPSYQGGDTKGGGGRYLLVPNNKSLPRFMCPSGTKEDKSKDDDNANNNKTLYRAEYTHGSWHESNKWPPCTHISRLCGTCNVQDETKALLVENGVDHGEFPPAVLRDVEESVRSGRFFGEKEEMGWKPTEDMCTGRRDYRKQRVFTIDPTTAKDLDDALHVTMLADGRVEIGVHIADVSHFIPSKSAVDEEALRRATTVYLVNDVIPMLPRPLCEIACSLNENVERLAFSCVWRMNMDGTLSKKGGVGSGKPKKDDIWYGRTVIKSCARLDYATAQNIIDKKVANGENQVDETFWPKSRQPTGCKEGGGHTIDEVASDVRLMHKVAMARRKLRFENGALALNGVKLAFQLETDGETPKLCAPYPIRDSNRLIEEFMLLANFLVAQRLITHAHGRAVLRNHAPPIELGMQQVVDVSKESFNFDIDTTDSTTLQESLSRLGRECKDPLVVQCVTESLMTPMRPAEYMAAGELEEVDWQHFALNIPYYTHFTSPIRRYPDVMVHRLLQATLDEEIEDFPMTQKEIHTAAGHCNDMRMSAKKASERSDRVFLSLYLKNNPISSTLGICLGVGEKTFTVFVPSLGMSTRVFLQEHEDEFNINSFEDSNNGKRRIVISPKTKNAVPGMTQPSDEGSSSSSNEDSWKSLDIRIFTKLEVACTCKMQPPIDVRVKVVGPMK